MPLASREFAKWPNLSGRGTIQNALPICSHRLLSIAVLGVSNAGDIENDQAIAAMGGLIIEAGHKMVDYAIVLDESQAICRQVQKWIDGREVDVILTTDVSCFSTGESPPDIMIVSDIDGSERSSTIVHHPYLGYIGVVELLTLPKKAA